MLPQWATRAFRSSESYRPRERLQSMLGCPLVLKGSKLASFRAVEIYQKIPGIVPPFDSIPLVARIKSRKEADQVVLASSKTLTGPTEEWPISLD